MKWLDLLRRRHARTGSILPMTDKDWRDLEELRRRREAAETKGVDGV